MNTLVQNDSHQQDVFDQKLAAYHEYLLIMHELAKESHQEQFESFIKALIKQGDSYDKMELTAEELAEVDVRVAHEQLDLLEISCPEICRNVRLRISMFDPHEQLSSAGYSDCEIALLDESGITKHVQVLMAFEDKFKNPEQPSIMNRLAAAKNNILGALSSENSKLLLPSIALSVAVGAGSGVAIPVAAAMYAAKLMENTKVQALMTRIEERISNTLVGWGLSKSRAESRRKPLGDRLKSVTDSAWFKYGKIPVTACMVMVGVASIADLSDLGSGLGSAKDAMTGAMDRLANTSAHFSESIKHLGFNEIGANPSALDLTDQAMALSTGEVEYTIGKNDTLWKLAEAHFTEVMGAEPSPQQVVLMINDLGLDNPNIVMPGDVVAFPNDLTTYLESRPVEADWLRDAGPSY